jgi:hypothetical protein
MTYVFLDKNVRMGVRQPSLLLSAVRFEQVVPPAGCVRVTGEIESAAKERQTETKNQ